MADFGDLQDRIRAKLREIKADDDDIKRTTISSDSNVNSQFDVYYLHSSFDNYSGKETKANKAIKKEILDFAKENSIHILATEPEECDDCGGHYQSPFDKNVKVYVNDLPKELSAVYIHFIDKNQTNKFKDLLSKLN